MKYYHITHPKNVQSISKNGIISNSNGEIFLFENKSIVIYGTENTIADSIAHNQLFLEKYAMFEIDVSGINFTLLQDDVREYTFCFQWILTNQNVILPEYVDYFGTFDTSYILLFANGNNLN